MKLNIKRTILVGFAFLLISMFWQVYDNVVAKILIDAFGLNQTASGVVMALDNILAVVLLPIFGIISDRVSSKQGKRTPFIFYGTIIASLIIVVASLFAYYQQVAIIDAQVGNVIKEGNQFSFQYFDSVTNQIKVLTNSDKSALTTLRSSIIFDNITKTNPLMLILFIGALFLVLLAMSTFRTPAVSLMPDVTPTPLRSKANAIINLMGTIGGVFGLGITAVLAVASSSLFTKYHYIPTFIATSLLMLLFLGIFTFTVKENKWVSEMQEFQAANNLIEEDEKIELEKTIAHKSKKMPKDVRRSFLLILTAVFLWFMAYNAATTKFSVYSTDFLDFSGYSLALIVANITAAISFIPIGILSTKFGRKRTVIVGVILLTIAFVLAIFVRTNTAFLMYLTMGLAGIAWATINVNSYPMVVEMSQSGDIGKYTGYYYTASMTAQIVTPILSGFIMDKTSLGTLFIYSTVFAALALIPMLFVKHGEPKHIETVKEV